MSKPDTGQISDRVVCSNLEQELLTIEYFYYRMDLEIETLLRLNHGPLSERDGNIQQLLNNQSVEDAVLGLKDYPQSPTLPAPPKYVRDFEINSVNEAEESRKEALIVRGSDIGDLPTEYEVIGLQQDEIPVIGELK